VFTQAHTCRTSPCAIQVLSRTKSVAARAHFPEHLKVAKQRSKQFIAPIAAALCLCGGAAHAESVVGVAKVIDGDTLEVAGTRLRLFGVDAPESKQLCTARSGKGYACGVSPFSLRVQNGSTLI
jgi:endonuclease YncB( thermonuclease family)